MSQVPPATPIFVSSYGYQNYNRVDQELAVNLNFLAHHFYFKLTPVLFTGPLQNNMVLWVFSLIRNDCQTFDPSIRMMRKPPSGFSRYKLKRKHEQLKTVTAEFTTKKNTGKEIICTLSLWKDMLAFMLTQDH